MEPVPFVDKTFSLVIQEERQRSSSIHVNPSVESIALAVKNQVFNCERLRPWPVFIGCCAKPTWMGGVVLLPLKMEVRLIIFFPFRLRVLQWSRHLFNYWKNKKTKIEKFIILLIFNRIYIDHRKITWLWS